MKKENAAFFKQIEYRCGFGLEDGSSRWNFEGNNPLLRPIDGGEKYVFYDSDATGNLEYTISGKEYEDLWRFCCQSATRISFSKTPGDEPKELSVLTSFLIAHGKKDHKIHPDAETVYFYRVCPEFFSVSIGIVERLFDWVNGFGLCHLNDPVFYRADGRVLFYSSIHDGYCSLITDPGEDVSHIVQKSGWGRVVEYQF